MSIQLKDILPLTVLQLFCVVYGHQNPLTLFQQCLLCTQNVEKMLKINIRNITQLECVSQHFQEPFSRHFLYVTTMDQCKILDGLFLGETQTPRMEPSKNFERVVQVEKIGPDNLVTCHDAQASEYIVAILELLILGLAIFILYLCLQKQQKPYIPSKNLKLNRGPDEGPSRDDCTHGPIKYQSDNENGSSSLQYLPSRSSKSNNLSSVQSHRTLSYIIPQRRYQPQKSLKSDLNWRNDEDRNYTSIDSWRLKCTSLYSPANRNVDYKLTDETDLKCSKTGNISPPAFSKNCDSNSSYIFDVLRRPYERSEIVELGIDDDQISTRNCENSSLEVFSDLSQSPSSSSSSSTTFDIESIDSQDESFTIVKRRKRIKRQRGLESLFIYTRRAETHFLQRQGSHLKRLKDLMDHVKFWKKMEHDDWDLPKSGTKTIFPYELRLILHQKILELTTNPDKLQEFIQDLSQNETETNDEVAVYLTDIDDPSVSGKKRPKSKKVIDLGLSEAVQLTRRFGTRNTIKATYIPSTPIQFVPYTWRPRTSVSLMETNHAKFNLHFNTEFISHLFREEEFQKTQMTTYMFQEAKTRNNSSGESSDENDDWTVETHKRRFINMSRRPYILLDFISIPVLQKMTQ